MVTWCRDEKVDTSCECCSEIIVWRELDSRYTRCADMMIDRNIGWMKMFKHLIGMIIFAFSRMHVMILFLHVVMLKACCLWFVKCNVTCICAVFFKVGEYCRRDALNFSHHRTTPRVCLICFPYHNESPYIIQISSLFAGSLTNRVLVPAFCFPQTALLCLSPRWNVTLLVAVMSWSET